MYCRIVWVRAENYILQVLLACYTVNTRQIEKLTMLGAEKDTAVLFWGDTNKKGETCCKNARLFCVKGKRIN